MDIPDFEYKISNLGRVWSIRRNRFLKERISNCGYARVALAKNGTYKHLSIHRLVALAFIPNPENKPEVNHKDGNKLNNHVDNLEWNTSSENQKHAFKNGLQKTSKGISKGVGSKNPKAKLTEAQVIKIRESDLNKKYELAIAYSVTPNLISQIIRGKIWKHLL